MREGKIICVDPILKSGKPFLALPPTLEMQPSGLVLVFFPKADLLPERLVDSEHGGCSTARREAFGARPLISEVKVWCKG